MEERCRNCKHFSYGKCTLLNDIISYPDEEQKDDIDIAIDKGEVAEATREEIKSALPNLSINDEDMERLVEAVEVVVRRFSSNRGPKQELSDPEIMDYNFKCNKYE